MLKFEEYIVEKISKESPLVLAAKKGNSKKVKQLIQTGVSPDEKNTSDGRTALMVAAEERFLVIVEWLIEKGCDVNLQDNHGATALMYANTPTIIDKLLEAGADVNLQNNEGNLAISMYLAKYHLAPSQVVEIFKKFMLKGLDLDIKNKKDETLYDILKSKIGAAYKSKELLWYIDEKYPQYKEEWELKRDVEKYNL